MRSEHSALPPWAPYVIPMVAFAGLSALEAANWIAYPVAYTLKAAGVAVALVACRSAWPDIRPDARVVLPAVLVGLAVLAEWVLVDRYLPGCRLGSRIGFNPYRGIPDPAWRAAFVAVRLTGLAVLVPLMEELFWRSFLIRVLSRPDWQSMDPGSFTAAGFSAVVAAFALAHPEWLAAGICAVAYGMLLGRTRSVFACVVAHAVTNFGLGIYVLATGTWLFW